jgi:hypothetical protein
MDPLYLSMRSSHCGHSIGTYLLYFAQSLGRYACCYIVVYLLPLLSFKSTKIAFLIGLGALALFM